jgi:NADH-quinone oxidoreductase subunit L
VFQASDSAMTTVAYIGAFTAIFAASIGIVMTDIKRVLAYSTISQLGYMMLALGVGGYIAAIFHLFTHAFFKALLFLGSGSVNHATRTFDMRKMGGLRSSMPITYATFVIGAISLAGVFPFAGFWSKDEILAFAWDDDKLLFGVAMVVVFMTAFYTFRAIFMTFHGEYKGGEAPEHGAHDAHAGTPHESPMVMALPLLILAVPAFAAGFVNLPFGDLDQLGVLLEGALPLESEELLHHAEFNLAIAVASTALALAGIGLAYAMYEAKSISAESVRDALGPVPQVVENKYYMDELYEDAVVRVGLMRYVTAWAQWFDTNVVDGVVNGSASVSKKASDALRWVQSGSAQAYGTVGFGGLVIASILMLVLVER